jgi:hypothetical protein
MLSSVITILLLVALPSLREKQRQGGGREIEIERVSLINMHILLHEEELIVAPL